MSGDVSNAKVLPFALGDSVYQMSLTQRPISYHVSDIPTLRDLGMNLVPDKGAPDITWLDSYWSTLGGGGGGDAVILPSGSHWPDNRHVPNSGAISKSSMVQSPIVMSFGTVTSRPGYNTPYGFGVPYYGDSVPSFTHDDANFTFSRVDSNESAVGDFVPLVSAEIVCDTPYDGGASGGSNNQIALEATSVTTPRDGGTYGNLVSNFYSKGYNYYGEMDVDQWSHSVARGTNWVWNNIQELYSPEPYYCDPTASGLCFATYMNEEDLYGVGPDRDLVQAPGAGSISTVLGSGVQMTASKL